jgi:hypothetical protein
MKSIFKNQNAKFLARVFVSQHPPAPANLAYVASAVPPGGGAAVIFRSPGHLADKAHKAPQVRKPPGR